MEVDWAKIMEKPDSKYKIEGNVLLKFRIQNENFQKEIASVKKKVTALEGENKKQSTSINQLKKQNEENQTTINEQKAKIDEQTTTLAGLENEMKDIIAAKEKEFEQQLKDSQSELDTAKKQLSELQPKINELQTQLSEKKSQNDELNAKNQELSDQLKKLEARSEETNTLKSKIDELQEKIIQQQKEIDEKVSQIDEKQAQIIQLNEKIQNVEKSKESDLAALKQEMENQQKEYEIEIQKLEDRVGLKPEKVKITEDVIVVYLRFTGEDFRFVRNQPEEGIYLILDKQEEKWLLVWDKDTPFIERRTAERIARSIAKAGWPLATGGREGMGFELEMQGEKSVPTRLLRDQHEYMD